MSQQFCHSRPLQILSPSPLQLLSGTGKPQLSHPNTFKEQYLSQEGLVTSSDQNQAQWCCFHYFMYFYVGFKTYAKVLYNWNEVSEFSQLLFPLSQGIIHQHFCSLKADGVKSPLMPHLIHFSAFSCIKSILLQCQRKTPLWMNPVKERRPETPKPVSIYRILLCCTSPKAVLQRNCNKSAMT